MYPTTGTRFMSSNKRSLRSTMAVACMVGAIMAPIFAVSAAQSEPHFYNCPTHITVDGSQLSLAGLGVFDGPVERLVALVPETLPGDPGAMIWTLDTGATPYMKCRYLGSQHYLILKAEGATRCKANVSGSKVFEASCS